MTPEELEGWLDDTEVDESWHQASLIAAVLANKLTELIHATLKTQPKDSEFYDVDAFVPKVEKPLPEPKNVPRRKEYTRALEVIDQWRSSAN